MFEFDNVDYFAMASGVLAAVAISSGDTNTQILITGLLAGLAGDIIYKIFTTKRDLNTNNANLFQSTVPHHTPGENVETTQVIANPKIVHLAPGFAHKYLSNTISMVSDVTEIEMNAKLQ